MNQEQELREMRDSSINEHTTVQIGLMLGIGILVTGFIISSVWWAAVISTKLDTIITCQTAQAATLNSVQSDVSDLKAWRKVIDNSGSPQVSAMMSKINELQKELEVHIAETENKAK
jgi:flagellar motor component MotA